MLDPALACLAKKSGTFMLSDAIVYSVIGMFAARVRPLLSKPWAARTTSRVSGVAMLGDAVRTEAER
jgi:threonine/homoserine/homoserine lactone efflux protein